MIIFEFYFAKECVDSVPNYTVLSKLSSAVVMSLFSVVGFFHEPICSHYLNNLS